MDSNCRLCAEDASGKKMLLYKWKFYAKECGFGLRKWRLIPTTGLVEHAELKLEKYPNIK